MMIFSMFFVIIKFYWFTNEECIINGQYFLSIINNGISGGDEMGFPTLKNKVNSFSNDAFIFQLY